VALPCRDVAALVAVLVGRAAGVGRDMALCCVAVVVGVVMRPFLVLLWL